MNQKQLIAVLEERIRLASSMQTKSAYQIVLGHIKAQPLFTIGEVSVIAKDSYDAATIDLDFEWWWAKYKEELIKKVQSKE